MPPGLPELVEAVLIIVVVSLLCYVRWGTWPWRLALEAETEIRPALPLILPAVFAAIASASYVAGVRTGAFVFGVLFVISLAFLAWRSKSDPHG